MMFSSTYTLVIVNISSGTCIIVKTLFPDCETYSFVASSFQSDWMVVSLSEECWSYTNFWTFVGWW